MKKLVLSIIIILNISVGRSQTVNMPKVVLPSPQSKLFEQYVDHVVSYETGVPEIVIPLFEIEIKGMKLPVNLSYHASGIKYDQYDGDIGVGWVLNPGYRVTRQIHGKPDESYAMPDMNNIETAINQRTSGFWRDRYLASFIYNRINDNAPKPETNYDGEYDHFCYMLPSGSGHFIISDRQNKQIAMLERSNYQVNYGLTGLPYNPIIENINIKDDNGVEFLLGKSSDGVSFKESAQSYWGAYPTAWPLMNIITPLGERINFSYIMGKQMEHGLTTQLITAYDAVHHASMSAITPSRKEVERGAFGGITNTFFLTEIDTDKELVKITRETGATERNRIKSIEVYRKIPTTQLFRKVDFFYSFEYIIGHGNRCLLDSIRISGENISGNRQRYEFDYYPGIDLSNSYADQWGYPHTGASGVGSFGVLHSEFENDKYQLESRMIPGNIKYFLDALFKEKSSNNGNVPNYYSLKRIYFPTGGCREYIYESNQFSRNGTVINGAGLRIKSINHYDNRNSPSPTEQFIYTYGSGTGKVSFDPTPIYFADELCYIDHYVNGWLISNGAAYIRKYATNILGDVNIDNHFYIYYPEVTESSKKAL